MIAVLGGLGAAVMWGATSLCSSRASRMIDPGCVLSWVMLVGLVVTVPAAAFSDVPADVDASLVGWLLLSGTGNVIGLLLEYTAFRAGQVGIIAPIASTEGAIAALIAIAAGESIAPGGGAMLAVVAIGVVLASSATSPEDTRVQADPRRAAALALAAAVFFGVSLYATGRVSDLVPTAWVILPARVVGVLAIAVPLVLASRLVLTRRALPLVLAAGVCEVVGFASFAIGARDGVAVASVMASQFAVFAAVAAFVLFNERLGRLQLLGVVVVVAGVAALSALQA